MKDMSITLSSTELHSDQFIDGPASGLVDDEVAESLVYHNETDRVLPIGFWILPLALCGAVVWFFAIKGFISWLD